MRRFYAPPENFSGEKITLSLEETRHLRDVLALWYEQFPETRGLILEGSAEPE